jgi:hypothetical protein
VKEDTPYWYGETTNSALLSTACFMAGGVSVVEAARPKGRGKDQWAGRGDLYLKWKNSSEEVEAKFCWYSFRSPNNILSVAKEWSEYAIEDAKNLDRSYYSANFAIGISFIAPDIKEDEKAGIDVFIEKAITTLKNSKNVFDVLAWCFPERMRRWVDTENKYLTPGIILTGKIAASVY